MDTDATKTKIAAFKSQAVAAAEAYKKLLEEARAEMFREEAERIVRIADATADCAKGFAVAQEDVDELYDQVANVIFRMEGALQYKFMGNVQGQDTLPSRKYEQVRQTLLDYTESVLEKIAGELKFVWDVSGDGKDRKLRQLLNKRKHPLRRRELEQDLLLC